MTTAILKKHVRILQKLTRKNRGALPSYTWLNANGYFGSYDTVRSAGLLWKFIRADRRGKSTDRLSAKFTPNR